MKVSELIKDLQEMLEEHGDMSVYGDPSSFPDNCPDEFVSVEMNPIVAKGKSRKAVWLFPEWDS